MKYDILPIPESLQPYVECIATAEYDGEESFAVNVCLNGLPGIIFQHNNGRSPVDYIYTPSGSVPAPAALVVYGQMTQPSIIHYKKEPFTTTQIILKPDALRTLLGINASLLTDSIVELSEFAATDLNMRLLEARNQQERLTLLTDFLLMKHDQAKTRDQLVDESLHLIHNNVGQIGVRHLLETLSLSERQFEKRFTQTVGLNPQFYIRVKRFNEAIRLMQTQPFDKLIDLAHGLNFYDQSHFIRDIKAFSGATPKRLFQKLTLRLEQQI